MLAVEVLWTPEEEVGGLAASATVPLCPSFQGEPPVTARLHPYSSRIAHGQDVHSVPGQRLGLGPLLPSRLRHWILLPACLQGDFFTVEDLAYDYPTLNTL